MDSVFLMLKVRRELARHSVFSFAVHRADSRRPAKSKFHSILQFQLLSILTIKTSIIWQLNDTWETQYIKNFRVYKCRGYTNT